jgi:MFS family permease
LEGYQYIFDMIRCPKILRWAVWSLSVAFLFFEYLLRVMPSGAPTQLMQAFSISATGFGAAMGFYFYAYTPMQIPAGLLMDRFGARMWLTLSALFCGFGGLLFAAAHGFYLASFSRLLIGAGSASAFVGLIYLSSHWFDPKRLPVLLGIGNSLGMLGAAIGEGPLSFLLAAFGFRFISTTLGLIGIVLGLVIFAIIRNDPPEGSHYSPPESDLTIPQSMRMVLANPQTWVNGIAAMLFYTTTAAFAGLWAPTFVQVAYNTSIQKAALASSLFFVGWMVGGPVIGKLARIFKRKKSLVVATPLLACAWILLLIYVPLHWKYWPHTCLFFAGVFSSGQLLHYTLAVKLNSLKTKGTTAAVTNCMVFIGTIIMQPLVGALLDLFWNGKAVAGVRLYSIEAYQKALIGFPLSLILAALISAFFLREKKSFTT